jgi:tRNA pseudouridine38-40 synthase
MNSFHSKTFCSGRIYEYLLPSYILAPPSTLPAIDFKMDEPIPKLEDSKLDELKKFRANPELLEKFNKVLSYYKGTKSYHNYSPYRYFGEASSKRVMRDFSVSKIFEENGSEWILLKVEGDSFMLNQIRKMVCKLNLKIR